MSWFSFKKNEKNTFNVEAAESLKKQGLMHFDNGNYDDAIYYLKKYIDETPSSLLMLFSSSDALACLALAASYQMKQDYDMELQYYKKLIDNPHSYRYNCARAGAYCRIATINSIMGNESEAILCYQKSAQLGNEDAKMRCRELNIHWND